MKNKNIENKFLPEGYKYLREGEAIMKGDYFWSDEEHKWCKVRFAGDTSNWINEHVIRKIQGDIKSGY